MFITALFVIKRSGNNPTIFQLGEYVNYKISTPCNTSQQQEEMNFW